MSVENRRIACVALPTPVPRLFDYRIPDSIGELKPGQRVEVGFGRRRMVGTVLALQTNTAVPQDKLKSLTRVLDTNACLPEDIIQLLHWCSAYYHHAIGEVVTQAIPARLRQGQAMEYVTESLWRLSQHIDPDEAVAQLVRAPKQRALYQWLQQYAQPASAELLNAQFENWRPSLKALLDKGFISESTQQVFPTPQPSTVAPTLSGEQRQAVENLTAAASYQVNLLQGITGSGKTEVYLACIEQQLAAGQQVLVLVPEIGLTPQLVQRFTQRLPASVGVAHSALSDSERHNIWLAASRGDIKVLIGTRSAVFTPFKQLGLIIIDEEHDASLKQHEGFRYHARDVAIYRARQADIPVVLGSATPSLESLYNCQQQKFQRIVLSQRAGEATLPRMQLLDVRGQKLVENTFSVQLIDRMRQHLSAGHQVLLFLNRRGYAPVLMCHDCGWLSHCPRCDAFMTFHHGKNKLRCHHCDHEKPVPTGCPDCQSENVSALGSGTERIEHALHDLFPDVPYVRIDRDSSRGKAPDGSSKLDNLFAQAHSGEAKILIGTQMLAKGHDIPGVTLVGILNSDQGFYSSDFRASEHMGQLIVQVAGRAGRAEHQGEVLIQTHHPEDPLFQPLLKHDYAGFGEVLLRERQQACFPPYSFHVMLRADATNDSAPFEFLQKARQQLQKLVQQQARLVGKNNTPQPVVEIYGPMAAPMARRAGRIRAQLLCQADSRQSLQQLLQHWLPQLYALPGQQKVRWSIDVDPVDTY